MYKTLFKSCLVALMAAMGSLSSYACTDDGGMQNVYIFGINLLGNNQFLSYYYNSPHMGDWCSPGNEQNIADWQQRYPEVKNADAFHELIYKMPLADLQRIQNGKSSNAFASLLQRKKDNAAFEYLIFAKTCEPYVMSTSANWEEGGETAKPDQGAMRELMERGMTAYNSTADMFFKQRYALQLLRLAFYSKDYNKTLELYNNVVTTGMPQNYVYYRTLMHKAFALKALNRVAEANLILAQIFDKSPALRCLAYRNLSLGTMYDSDGSEYAQNWTKTLAAAKTEQEKAVLWMVRNVQEDKLDLDATNQVMQLAPGQSLEVMLLKQLKHLETEVYLPFIQKPSKLDSTALTYGEISLDMNAAPAAAQETSWIKSVWQSIVNFFKNLFGSKDKGALTPTVLKAQTPMSADSALMARTPQSLKDHQQIRDLEEIALKVAADEKTARPALFYLAAAYLKIMREDFSDARDDIKKARKHIQTDALDKPLDNQATYLEVLAMVMETETMDQEKEQQVYDAVQKLWKDKAPNDGWQRLFLFTEIGRRYLKNNDLTKAILSWHFVKQKDNSYLLMDMYATPGDLDHLLAYVQSNPSGDFEKMLVQDFKIGQGNLKDIILDIQGTQLARAGKFSDGLAKLKAISPAYWHKTPPAEEKAQDKSSGWFGNQGVSYDYYYDGYNYYYSGCDTFRTSFTANAAETSTDFGSYSKLTFLEKVVELEQKAAQTTGDEAANHYFSLGNGFYHSPFWAYNGALWKCSMLLSSLRMLSPVDYPFNLDNISTKLHNGKMGFVKSYCRPSWALTFYEKAAGAAKDRELAARSLFCARAATENELATHWEPQIALNGDRFFAKLKGQYADTETYSRMSTSCSYLKDFNAQ